MAKRFLKRNSDAHIASSPEAGKAPQCRSICRSSGSAGPQAPRSRKHRRTTVRPQGHPSDPTWCGLPHRETGTRRGTCSAGEGDPGARDTHWHRRGRGPEEGDGPLGEDSAEPRLAELVEGQRAERQNGPAHPPPNTKEEIWWGQPGTRPEVESAWLLGTVMGLWRWDALGGAAGRDLRRACGGT
ncbi:hypothetical protein NDU88_002425 [Pleurodeles waltl]|uniref:Uncharacterized protein n=1 Tax=Pleurodeles waltl TaxID=8319 RepID=A0AAV7NDQ4_PLEWA|nr:hypothetical protein NDU88_002425 [Pleurodeles waltl]